MELKTTDEFEMKVDRLRDVPTEIPGPQVNKFIPILTCDTNHVALKFEISPCVLIKRTFLTQSYQADLTHTG